MRPSARVRSKRDDESRELAAETIARSRDHHLRRIISLSDLRLRRLSLARPSHSSAQNALNVTRMNAIVYRFSLNTRETALRNVTEVESAASNACIIRISPNRAAAGAEAMCSRESGNRNRNEATKINERRPRRTFAFVCALDEIIKSRPCEYACVAFPRVFFIPQLHSLARCCYSFFFFGRSLNSNDSVDRHVRVCVNRRQLF